MVTMVRAVTLNGYFQLTRRLGINPQALLQQAELDATMLANPEHRIPIAALCELLEATAHAASCPTFGLQLAEARQELDFGVIGLMFAHKRTLREVLQAAIQYRNLLNEALALHVETADDKVVIREEIVVDAEVPMRQATELAVGVLARTCGALLGTSWHPSSVHFTHSKLADTRFYRQLFGCPLVFESDFNGIVCTAADLDCPNPTADLELVRYTESLLEPLSHADEDSIVQEVRKAIYLLLPLELATIEQVAQRLHVGTRTMQRQLDSAGTSFSELVEQVRHNLALRYMMNARYPIGRVALLLGYTRQASFTRWFTAQFGMTPRAWRTAKTNRLQ
ncbi:AraC-like DNA-binding protein [Paraburkholderia sp. BL6665CI2N2]|uniref:AraC family transcriptional regulator n=1 Tax=Paraburkholderia sp. BL6665CI2N2 TaxID=1938806 RepID=UPI0010647B60|nr:AraC family transcriptional regulator [Paraburkholderia sp. BL6665CI2N2]TDY21382.1 AraC-like DNA-binding protein [Paraburkholderia sp. BL6665CI2N2]